MKKLLIIGDDVHSTRYISSILYNDDIEIFILDYNNKTKDIIDQYKIDKIEINELSKDINNFDYILYTLPNKFDEKIYEKIKNYKNNLLLEKPQLNISLIGKLDCKKYFIHLRYFDQNKKVNIKDNNKIKWPNLNHDGMDPIINTMPNIIDYLVSINNNNEVNIVKVKNNKNDIDIHLIINDKSFMVKIINTDDTKILPTINDEVIAWPNYFICISNLIKELLNDNIDFNNSITKEEKYVEIINKIRGEINGYKKNEI